MSDTPRTSSLQPSLCVPCSTFPLHPDTLLLLSAFCRPLRRSGAKALEYLSVFDTDEEDECGGVGQPPELVSDSEESIVSVLGKLWLSGLRMPWKNWKRHNKNILMKPKGSGTKFKKFCLIGHEFKSCLGCFLSNQLIYWLDMVRTLNIGRKITVGSHEQKHVWSLHYLWLIVAVHFGQRPSFNYLFW